MSVIKNYFEKFLANSFGLEIWSGKKMIFRSNNEGIKGLLDFIRKYNHRFKNLVIFDKIVGRGIALLAIYLKAKAVYGRTGSELAEKALKKSKIKFYFQETIPHILNKKGDGFCPFEKLSLNKKPKEFYNLVKNS